MNTLEDRVRAALNAHAADFTASPDAWEQLQDRGTFRTRVRRRPRWARTAIPLAAAAAVIAIVAAATITAHGFFGSLKATVGTPGTAPASATPGGDESSLFTWFPPSGAVLDLKLAQGSNRATAHLWLSGGNPAYWRQWIVSGPQLCEDAVNQTPGTFAGDEEGFCKPLPRLSGDRQVMITGSAQVGLGVSVSGQLVKVGPAAQPLIIGIAASQVTSVTAVLPGGRTYPGTVGTGRGFPDKAWAVTYPVSQGVRLVFRDTSGQVVADQRVTLVGSELPIARPRTGGVTVFRYPGGSGIPAGPVQAYLIEGRVGFFGVTTPQVSPVPAADAPGLGGLSYYLSSGVVAAGYAHADVTRVVLRLRDGEQVTARTFAAGWPGSDLRLWTANLPKSAWTEEEHTGTVAATVIAYDAAGQVVGRVALGNATP